MSRILRIALVFVAVLLILVIVVALTAVAAVRRPFPKTAGTINLPGLQDEVQVYRDDYGIPHIYANNEYDLFFAQGYVHAQDRFWQMEFWRHVGQGRISEIAGGGTTTQDTFIRTMGWNRIAAETLAYYQETEPELMTILEAYSDGVNAYIAQNGDQSSINYTVLGLVNDQWEIEPWTPLHTVAWGVVMSNDLGGNWSAEVTRARLVKELGAATVANLLPTYPYDRRPVIAPTEALDIDFDADTEANWEWATAVDWRNLNTDIVGDSPAPFTLGEGPFLGSNNWVVGGQHTDTGLPYLANDPHLGIQMPSIWYQIGLHAPGWDVTGFSFAGAPGVVLGHNGRIAWGVTNVGPDVQDLYVIKTNPSNPNQYEYMGEWREMDIIEEVIKVNGGETITLPVYLTHHGPIISELRDDTQDLLAIRWTAHEPSRLFKSVIMLNQAQDFAEFREALRYWDMPSQNFVYADVDGNIGYQAPGLIPIRRRGDGLLPVPGWTDEYEWDGWIPFEEMPYLFNPPSGYIATANNAIVDEAYPHLINIYWADGDRAQRIVAMIEERLAGGGKLTIEDMAVIQLDSYSLMADSYIPLLANLSSNDANTQAALERLRGWDRQLRRDSVPAALFEIFRMKLAYAALADEVGEENVTHFGGLTLFHALAAEPDAAWWNNVNTAVTETREDILRQALADTIVWFEENVGGSMNDWTWGAIHTATFVSAPLGQSGIGPVESLVNRGPFPADGGSSIVNANSWRWSAPAAVAGHVSMRMIVDMRDLDNSLAVNPTGQSGHPYHRHYDDMIAMWLNGDYHPMLWRREMVEETAVDRLILRPDQ